MQEVHDDSVSLLRQRDASHAHCAMTAKTPASRTSPTIHGSGCRSERYAGVATRKDEKRPVRAASSYLRSASSGMSGR
jgi:hypothetical protein